MPAVVQSSPSNTPVVGTAAEWLDARLALLDDEKEHTRQADALAARRRALPWVPVQKDYRFDTDAGTVSLADLFQGRSQLLLYHFMFGVDYTAGCPSCSSIADGFNGIAVHLAHHDVTLGAVSRAPLAKLQVYKQRMGWTFPWASALDAAFSSDFKVGFSVEEQGAGLTYNFRRESPMLQPPTQPAAMTASPPKRAAFREWTLQNDTTPVGTLADMSGVDVPGYTRERPGISAFALRDGVVYHTYSSYARGLDGIWGMYQWLDRAPLGRNEHGVWWRRHDEYATAISEAR